VVENVRVLVNVDMGERRGVGEREKRESKRKKERAKEREKEK
jgi:hypothetical protein